MLLQHCQHTALAIPIIILERKTTLTKRLATCTTKYSGTQLKK